MLASETSEWISDRCDRLKASVQKMDDRLADLSLPDHRTGQDAIEGGLIRELFADVWDCGPFSPYLPEEMGGSGANAASVISMLDTTSYHHLPLSLAIALNGGLFLLPVTRYADASLAEEVLARFSGDDPVIGGMMMTEPGCGTDLFAAATAANRSASGTRIQGEKHWSGMTGHADYWLIFARDDEAPRRERFAYHLAPVREANGGIEVKEYYRAQGLSPIPYGRTRLDVELASNTRLGTGEAYPTIVASILQRSRLTTSGVAHGFLRRLVDEARAHTESRIVLGRPLSALDQVASRLERIEYAEILTRAMCAFVVEQVGSLHEASSETRGCSLVIKALAADLMWESAGNLGLLRGSSGYRGTAFGFGAIADAHPFRIFEGPNDMLYDQIAGDALRRRCGETLGDLLALRSFVPESKVVSQLLDYELQGLAQRERVLVGRALAVGDALSWMTSADSLFTARERQLAQEQGEADIGRLALSLSLSRGGAAGEVVA